MDSAKCSNIKTELDISRQLLAPINLATLNTDCQQHIFDRLGWTDLMSLADASKLLRKAVYSTFQRKYRNARIDIGVCNWYRYISFDCDIDHANVNVMLSIS